MPTGLNEHSLIAVSTPDGKRALAAALAEHDPDFLADLKMIAAKLGPFAAVHYASTRPDVQALVEADVAAARLRHRTERRANFKKEIAAMKELLK